MPFLAGPVTYVRRYNNMDITSEQIFRKVRRTHWHKNMNFQIVTGFGKTHHLCTKIDIEKNVIQLFKV